ncbi:hypothetical protein AMJ52_06370 [candidate division TA06 bacterium DG_78]|uniref:Radical SAM core domain-containing protein n=1 Tax=candidate division TA06 bacterium DG_78 TaxID=1703772 RepID=A0A0S7YCH2_UNCT6|nr:MAG: hypothetical protein AMJ52_06370 [candidate division TA06 bacterium DG_78]
MDLIYFRFFPDCHYIRGPVRGAIYKITLGKIMHLSKVETEIVNRWLANERIDSVELKYPKVAKELLSRLIGEGIGTVFPTPVYTEPFEPSASHIMEQLFEQPPVIKKAYIQVNNKCNAHCLFCGSSDYYVSAGCVTCLQWPQKRKSSNIDELTFGMLTKQLADLETHTLIFSGGNPLLEWNKLIAIVRKAINHRSSIKTIVNTNSYGFNEKIAKDAKNLNIQFNFTVFSDSREGYKKITGSEEIFNSLLQAVELCKANDITYGISLLTCPESHDNYDKIQQFAKNLGGVFLGNSEIFLKAGAKKPLAALPIGEKQGEKRFSKIDSKNFLEAKHFSRCLHGVIAISCHGIISPCPILTKPVGKIPKDDIVSIFRNKKLDPYWTFNKTKVPKCKECEFRFACVDCAVTENYRKKDPSIHNAVCTYQPDKGEWVS